jgi:DNA-binding response OmpR family regulator
MPHILIVDDHARLLEAMQEELQGEYRVTTARTAGEAAESMARQMPDVIIVDHLMPYLSGLDFIQMLREKLDEPKIIFFSAALSDQLAVQARAAGAAACFPKPFDFGEMKRTIAVLLGASTSLN